MVQTALENYHDGGSCSSHSHEVCDNIPGRDGHMVGVVGPNAITQVAGVLSEARGEALCRDIFRAAGLEAMLDTPPHQMVSQWQVARLQRAVRDMLPEADANARFARAGQKTADYVMANRIPGLVCRILIALPPSLAGPLLSHAIGKHAWTFAGAGTFSIDWGGMARSPIATVEITGCPLAILQERPEPVCHLYAFTFEHLFRTLVSPRIVVEETHCIARGDRVCRFALRQFHATRETRTNS
ncbi:MAG: bacteriochlorophyll 4-vinyl reductase [Pseudomonadota bacterium]